MKLSLVRQWGLRAFVIGTTAAIVVLFVLLLPALHKVNLQANAGASAQVRSCKLIPTSIALFTHAEAAGWISAQGLADVKSSIPALHCPAS